MNARFAALGFSLLLYGIFGSPTPNNPGWVELLVAILMLASIHPRDVHAVFNGCLPPYRAAVIPLFIWGLSVPLIIGAIQMHPLILIGRDVTAFLLLCLPLFLWPQNHVRSFLFILMAVAVMFSLRVLGEAWGWLPSSYELLYLANSPLVIFTAIAGLCMAGQDMYNRALSHRSFLLLAAGAVCLLAMLVDVQRATITAVILSVGLMAMIGFVKAPARMMGPLLVLVTFMIMGWEVIYATWQGMAFKTALVGVNARSEELVAVWALLAGHPFAAFFGIGWGGQFDSPAVGGMAVTYTHSLLSYMLLKTGLLGLGLTLQVLAGCAFSLTRYIRQDPIIVLALGWAIVIPVVFYASYKSLDFGLVLLLALLLTRGIASRPI